MLSDYTLSGVPNESPNEYQFNQEIEATERVSAMFKDALADWLIQTDRIKNRRIFCYLN